MSARLPFHREPNLNSTLYRISDHHQQEASSFFPCDRTLVSYGHHNNGQREANHVFHQLPGYHHHNYQQPIPRFKSMYPRSSFFVDCTGDACKGDVFFKQDVYKQRNILGKQGTIVGRIVKEIYLTPQRRHDFTIEVLWTKGSLLLRPLSVVVVKDWNIYRFGTIRQPWENKAERSEALREKHRQILLPVTMQSLTLQNFFFSNNSHRRSEDANERSNKDTRLMGPVLSSSSSNFKPQFSKFADISKGHKIRT
ncbi:hypothetical protein Tco_1410807 [Tanacetum coccineum]